VFIGTSWTQITLNEPPRPGSDVDTDKDGLTDWEEIDTDSGLIIYDDTGIIRLPSIQEAIDFVNRDGCFPNAAISLKRFSNPDTGGIDVDIFLLYTLFLPIHSNPAEKYTTNDGICDFNSPQPLVFFREAISWDVWQNIDMNEYMRKRNITEIVFTGVHRVGPTTAFHSSVIIFVAPGSDFHPVGGTNSNHKYFLKTEWDNIYYATLSAGELNKSMALRVIISAGVSKIGGICLIRAIASGELILLESSINRNADANLRTKVEMINMGRLDSETIALLFERELYYRENNIKNVTYWFFPEHFAEGKFYNSNSFLHGLLLAVDILPIKPRKNVPGWDSPLPANLFGVYV
jgi:hypothetical protein